jgi:hypothetical protein
MAIGDNVEMENRGEHELQFEKRNSQHFHKCVINQLQRLIRIDYLYHNSFLALILCCSVVSLGFILPAGAQNNIDNSEKITYTHYKTPVNGIFMHYVIGGKGDPIVLLHGWPQRGTNGGMLYLS